MTNSSNPSNPLDPESLRELWNRFKRTGHETYRNQLLEHYLAYVRTTAERLRTRLPAEVDVEDLISVGLFGLIDALNNFDPDRGVKFETFCTQRIRGSILDHLRSNDWVPRLVRSRSAMLEKARRDLTMKLGCNPSQEELAEELGVGQEEFEKIIRDSLPVQISSLDKPWSETDSHKDVRDSDLISDGDDFNPMRLAESGNLRESLMRNLSRSERLILVLYYYEDLTMKEIGQVLELSESRVSQMHSSILARLRAQFNATDAG